jgi:transcription antitermination factor NusB
MSDSAPHRDDRRRELTLWILVSADAAAIGTDEAADRLEAHVAGSAEPDPTPAGALYRPERLDAYLPSEGEWHRHAERARDVARAAWQHRQTIDEAIREASPRWRIDRMPPIDRALLRMGVAEMVHCEGIRPRATINGLVELAKRYGEESTPRFVNGILDQVRRNLGIDFG